MTAPVVQPLATRYSRAERVPRPQPVVPRSREFLGQGAEIDALCHKWQAAVPPGDTLPPFEEIALDNLGRSADATALLAHTCDGGFEILRAGAYFASRVQSGARGTGISDLRANWCRVLRQVLREAEASHRPTRAVAHDVYGGFVVSFDAAAFPLKPGWGRKFSLLFVREQAHKYSLLDAIFNATRDGFLTLTPIMDQSRSPIDFQIMSLNEGAARLLQKPIEELRWRLISELFADPDAADLLRQLTTVCATGAEKTFELDYSPVPGSRAPLAVSVASLGQLLSVTLTDIGGLREREASFRLLFEASPVPMWLFDIETLRFLGVNDAAVKHYGYSREQFLELTLLHIRPEEDWEALKQAVCNVEVLHRSDQMCRHIRADGSKIDVLTYARMVEFQDRRAALVAIVDITERRQAEARVAHMAHHDALTDLPNRVLFHASLESALARLRPDKSSLAVLCLDLDHFKNVNDTLGHPIGDQLLQAVAARLRHAMAKGDVVARLGGDEFAIIQTDVRAPSEVSALAGRLADVVSRPYDIAGHHVIVGASVGIALAPSDGDDPNTLIKNADMALYRAKADGRQTFRFFEPEMDARLQARRVLELALRKAFAVGEFELHYQPFVNLEADRVSGFEALLRWRHPERGFISPAEFIPLAEEIGLIVPIGAWVLRQACKQAMSWPADIKVAVNLSPVQFKSRDLVPTVVSALSSSGLSPSRLELEITETVLLTESEANMITLRQLRDLGVRISMDDFGTGYSSLSYLRAFPFDKIKIDQSFVREVANSPDCLAIVRAVTELGASLGMATTAEGVETPEQLRLLRERNCTEVQGFLFSAPRPVGELPHLLESLDRQAKRVA